VIRDLLLKTTPRKKSTSGELAFNYIDECYINDRYTSLHTKFKTEQRKTETVRV